jgi:sigma-B regulation protein RsbU (phosphoserine phosphatase)
MEKNNLCYRYTELLRDYLESPSWRTKVSLLGKEFIRKGIGPEEIVKMHYKSIEKLLEDVSLSDEKDAVLKSFKVLLEIMMAYGMAYKHYQDMKAHESDIS